MIFLNHFWIHEFFWESSEKVYIISTEKYTDIDPFIYLEGICVFSEVHIWTLGLELLV